MHYISRFPWQSFPEVSSQAQWKKALKRGWVTIQSKRAKDGDLYNEIKDVDIQIPSRKAPAIPINPTGIECVYEDEYLGIIYKPAGIESSGNFRKSLQGYLDQRAPRDHSYLLCHRLDYATQGLLVFSKTREARRAIGVLLEEGTIVRRYAALLHGHLHQKTSWKDAIEGKPSHTEILTWRNFLLKSAPLCSVELEIKTGRYHQIRKHSEMHGHGILGDTLFPKPALHGKQRGLYLCATGLSFQHPILRKKIHYSHSIPSKFAAILNRSKAIFS